MNETREKWDTPCCPNIPCNNAESSRPPKIWQLKARSVTGINNLYYFWGAKKTLENIYKSGISKKNLKELRPGL